MITFAPEPETRHLETGTEYRWPSPDGRWAIVQIASEYIRWPRSIRFRLVRILAAGEYIVIRCHCRRAAVRKARELDATKARARRRRMANR
jgi:hypothetical protein